MGNKEPDGLCFIAVGRKVGYLAEYFSPITELRVEL